MITITFIKRAALAVLVKRSNAVRAAKSLLRRSGPQAFITAMSALPPHSVRHGSVTARAVAPGYGSAHFIAFEYRIDGKPASEAEVKKALVGEAPAQVVKNSVPGPTSCSIISR